MGLRIKATVESVKIITAGDGVCVCVHVIVRVCLSVCLLISGCTPLTFCYQHNRKIISQLGGRYALLIAICIGDYLHSH